MRRMLLVLVCLAFWTLPACSDDDGLALGEPCNAHTECASGLCTIPSAPDGGFGDAGMPQKRCMSPGL